MYQVQIGALEKTNNNGFLCTPSSYKQILDIIWEAEVGVGDTMIVWRRGGRTYITTAQNLDPKIQHGSSCNPIPAGLKTLRKGRDCIITYTSSVYQSFSCKW